MLTVVAVLAGTLVGWVLTRLLASLGYRRPVEAGRPAPANRWWLIPATGAAWGWVVITLANQPEAVIVMWLPLTAALGWIAAVDLDVQRIPDRALRPTAIWVGTCLMALAISELVRSFRSTRRRGRVASHGASWRGRYSVSATVLA